MKCNKCNFCNSESTKIYRFFVGTEPSETGGSIKWEYYGEPIYTCDRHLLSHDKWCMNGDFITEDK
jgi:hypothetical protein